MKYSKRKSKKEKLKNLMEGAGVFVYENNTDADLSLPKPSIEGFKLIGPRKRFKGDSYFMSLVKTPICLLRLIEEVKDEEIKTEDIVKDEEVLKNIPETIKEEEKKETKLINNKRKAKKKKKTKKAKTKKGEKMKEKLILDQPDVVTNSGKMEQKGLENQEETVESQEEKLLTENPSGNIEIISE